MASAVEYYRREIKLPDGSLISAVIWKLPEITPERTQGYKYRLNYCTSGGVTLVRCDNKLGKGDHKHLGLQQMPYQFQDIDKLLNDFWLDVEKILEENQNE